MILTSSIENIKGIGPKTAEKLQAAGLLTVADLLEFYPRRYEDFSQAQQIADLQPGKVLVKAEVESVNVRTVRRGMSVTTAVLSDGSGKVQATWFNQPKVPM
jgi:ATP-dependent DNA helicase RecG